jgi:AcrR family transcriptional regulator
MAPSDVPTRPLRRDAEANRLRILAAAEEVLAARGLDVGVDEIAQAAGVGVGTLYRRFPTKEELVAAILQARAAELVEAATAAAAGEPDPGAALRAGLRACALRIVRHRAFLTAVLGPLRSSPRVRAARRTLLDGLAPLLARAQEAGAVRADVVVEDLPVLLSAVGRGGRPVERSLVLVLDSLRPQGATPLPDAPAG